jgi:FtsP/CotA-like multicopper oxidase with cupredoxin domain
MHFPAQGFQAQAERRAVRRDRGARPRLFRPPASDGLSPFHVHGAGRFIILARDDVVEPNLVWKDTVLVRTGETVDILLDVTNPGRWMAHCHIAEHHESGMMFSFNVAPAGD